MLYGRFYSDPELAHGQPHVLATAAHLSRDPSRFSSFQLSAAAKHLHQQLPRLMPMPSPFATHTSISAHPASFGKIEWPATWAH